MLIYKFGGASVKDAESVKNVAKIIQNSEDKVVVVVSAMAKTTNALEEVVNHYFNCESSLALEKGERIIRFHSRIVADLGLDTDKEFTELISSVYDRFKQKLNSDASSNYDFEYDQIVSYGEIISTTIVSGYLNYLQIENTWLDARKMIRTNNHFRKAEIDWNTTSELIQKRVYNESLSKIFITQGFVGHTDTAFTTTLGREGSDFTAGILGYCLNAKEVIIWKDVPGMLNADPRYFNNCQKLDQISYKEAIELSYFGASVIHPKTVKPLQNKGIPLWVKSFIDPSAQGTLISQNSDNDSLIPSYIFKSNQTLVSIAPKDFSFVVEHNLSEIFAVLASHKVTVSLMQNSALSFSFCSDDTLELRNVIDQLKESYVVKYNDNLSLLTVRHYTDEVLTTLLQNSLTLVEQKSRHTARYVLKTDLGK